MAKFRDNISIFHNRFPRIHAIEQLNNTLKDRPVWRVFHKEGTYFSKMEWTIGVSSSVMSTTGPGFSVDRTAQ